MDSFAVPPETYILYLTRTPLGQFVSERYTMSPDYFRPALLILLFVTVLTSCDDDDVVPIDPTETTPDKPLELGEFYLLESSVAMFPYKSDVRVVYVNAAGEEITLTVEVDPITQPQVGTYASYIWEDGEAVDTIYYNYGGQNLTARMRSIELDIEFEVSLGTALWYEDLSSGSIADILIVAFEGIGLFSHLTDPRSWPGEYDWSTQPDTVTFLDRAFSDAMTDTRPGGLPLAHPWFNYSEGIIAFHDRDSTLWRFERFE